MTAAHLHLLINHLPVFGAALAIPLLALAILHRAERGALRAAILVLTMAGAGALGALWTGDPAEADVMSSVPEANDEAIGIHEDRAKLATGLASLATLAGIALLVVAERRRSVPVLPAVGVLVATIVVAGAMAWTGAAGGVIRHTEILPPGATAPKPDVEDAAKNRPGQARKQE